MSELLQKIEEQVTPLLQAENVELVDLTYQNEQAGWTLCFYLDKPGGITLDDCEKWNDRLGPFIEELGLIERSYRLEVSSPGLNRALRKTADFTKYAGERVHVKLYAPINGQKNFHGNLLGGDDRSIRVKLEDGRDVELPRDQVAKCRLDPTITI
ncbi:MAG: ribosome maturation factor RimP [Elusimicrobia bacterium]|nr:ribosome maturation factor RimP [Elusimicrobiota bacterium]